VPVKVHLEASNVTVPSGSRTCKSPVSVKAFPVSSAVIEVRKVPVPGANPSPASVSIKIVSRSAVRSPVGVQAPTPTLALSGLVTSR